MSWTCRIVAEPTTKEEGDRIRPGDMWYVEIEDEFDRIRYLSPEHAGKRPMIVRLPGPVDFAIYGPTWANGEPGPHGWVVTGEAPLLTLSPSINVGRVYHGYLQDGVITPDIDGRKFNEDGGRIYAQP